MSERADAVEPSKRSKLPPPSVPLQLARGKPTSRSRCSIAGIVAWGFWKTYYSQAFARADLPAIVHVHAAVFSIWVLRARRAGRGRRRGERALAPAARHCRNDLRRARVRGRAVGQRRCAGVARARGFYPLEVGGVIALYNLTDMLLFGAFLALAFVYRNRPELHKRWIIAATAALCGAALGPRRAWRHAAVLAAVAVAAACDDRRRSRDAAARASGSQCSAARCSSSRSSKCRCYAAPIWRDVGGRCCGHLSELRCLFYDFSRIWTEGWPVTA